MAFSPHSFRLTLVICPKLSDLTNFINSSLIVTVYIFVHKIKYLLYTS